MELDKLAVLAIGGAEVAGIYAIVMRLADLTAVPVRAFNMLLVQKMMRAAETLRSFRTRAGIELLIFAVSAAGFASLAAVLWLYPNALGRNVSLVAGVLALASVCRVFAIWSNTTRNFSMRAARRACACSISGFWRR